MQKDTHESYDSHGCIIPIEVQFIPQCYDRCLAVKLHLRLAVDDSEASASLGLSSTSGLAKKSCCTIVVGAINMSHPKHPKSLSTQP